MEQERVWSRQDQPGMEHLHLAENSDGAIANSLIIGVHQELPFRLEYTVFSDAEWYTREVRISVLSSEAANLQLYSDGEGHWVNQAGEMLPDLEGCLDIDISGTPFTNTLPIRRLNLAVGASSEITVVYIRIPELDYFPLKQRYTCVGSGAKGATYRYESLHNHFSAELDVDRSGLVVHYEGLFKLVFPS